MNTDEAIRLLKEIGYDDEAIQRIVEYHETTGIDYKDIGCFGAQGIE